MLLKIYIYFLVSQGSSWAFEMTDEKCVCVCVCAHHLVSTPYTLLSLRALCSPPSALAILGSAGSAPSCSQLHLLHPPSSQFRAISCQSSQENLASFPNPLPRFQVPGSSPRSSEPAAITSPEPRTSRSPQPSVFEGRCHSPQQERAATCQYRHLPWPGCAQQR